MDLGIKPNTFIFMKALRIFAAVLVATLALSCKTNTVKVDVELPTTADVDSVSYLIGVNFGSFLKGNGFCDKLSELNMSEVKKGMNDFLKAEGSVYDENFGDQFKVNPNEMGRILNGFLSKKSEYKAAENLVKERNSSRRTSRTALTPPLQVFSTQSQRKAQSTRFSLRTPFGYSTRARPSTARSSTAIWTRKSLPSSSQTA